MTNGNGQPVDRLDRIENILEVLAHSQVINQQQIVANTQQIVANTEMIAGLGSKIDALAVQVQANADQIVANTEMIAGLGSKIDALAVQVQANADQTARNTEAIADLRTVSAESAVVLDGLLAAIQVTVATLQARRHQGTRGS